MSTRCLPSAWFLAIVMALSAALSAQSSSSPSSSPSSSSKQVKKTAAADQAWLDPGSVSDGVYRNKSLGFTFKIPPGWVLRTEELSAPAEETSSDSVGSAPATSAAGAKVLLAAFSRPPEAKGEDVNSSILIVAEAVTAYPGLKEPAQYFEPLTEVAKARGFEVDEDPYEVAMGTKTLVRGDFHKNLGTRVMRQSTLAMLASRYAVSITVIAGTEDEVEELVDGLSFAGPAKAPPK